MHDRRWQYKVESVKTGVFSTPEKNDALIAERLTRLGLEGWELVSVTEESHYRRLYLKRS